MRSLQLLLLPLSAFCFTAISRVFVSTPVSKYPKRSVQDCCTSPPPLTLSPTTSVHDAMGLLLHSNLQGAPVVHRDQVVGVVSLLDFLWEEAFEGSLLPIDASNHEKYEAAARKIAGTTVQDVMRRQLPVLKPKTTMREAALLLDQHKTHLLAVTNDEGVLVGVLTSANVVTDLMHTYKSLPASSPHP